MATQSKQEIIDSIDKLKQSIARVTGVAGKEDRLAKFEEALKKQEDLLAQVEAGTTLPQPTQGADADDNAMLQILATMQGLMNQSGGGADSAEIQSMIDAAFAQRKINLSDLTDEVLEEIKKNQRVIMELPAYGKIIQMEKADSKIPHIYDILDDMLAGNNVYLIGDAGSGKTYGAEQAAKILGRELSVINCSQYTSPTEIIGGQTIEGYKDGKLILAWRDGKVLLLDEMPKLDPNTAGLFNDAFAKSSKTRAASNAKINSANPDEPPIQRNKDFAVIATGNVYPNTRPDPKYLGNSQQDLSLLDRFSGSVYYVTYDKYIDQVSCRYEFLFDMLVGNYYEYMEEKRKGNPTPPPRGLRTVLEDTNLKNYALTSYRTLTAFRVAFEYMLIRAKENEGKPAEERFDINKGKTVLKTWQSYLVAFDETAKRTIINTTKFTDDYIKDKCNETLDMILKDKQEGYKNSLAPDVRSDAQKYYDNSAEWIVAERYLIP